MYSACTDVLAYVIPIAAKRVGAWNLHWSRRTGTPRGVWTHRRARESPRTTCANRMQLYRGTFSVAPATKLISFSDDYLDLTHRVYRFYGLQLHLTWTSYLFWFQKRFLVFKWRLPVSSDSRATSLRFLMATSLLFILTIYLSQIRDLSSSNLHSISVTSSTTSFKLNSSCGAAFI